ncbi:hypothetical protein DUI87_11672 [Hirundo rustica rustica]|uniref:Uncharacterized protein n=1 Tax=Hirundo rustica rustica TaxID=333673 RepID=A0A3M0KEF6_HIRRU|nr:hypothetical protein DUI87_11672 [Hirundo rustica rustica]
MAGFADLNLPQGLDKKSLQSLLEAAAHLGYSTVALNHVIDFKEKKQEIIKPVSPSELFPSLPIVQGTTKRIKVLTRLTLIVSDPAHCNLLIACTTLDVDLVCIHVTEKLPFYFRRPPVNMAIDRGIYFELLYTPAIKDSTMRRYTISNAISLMQICKGKNNACVVMVCDSQNKASPEKLDLASECQLDLENLKWDVELGSSGCASHVVVDELESTG